MCRSSRLRFAAPVLYRLTVSSLVQTATVMRPYGSILLRAGLTRFLQARGAATAVEVAGGPRGSGTNRSCGRADLDLIFNALLNGRVPPLWLKTYPSLKPLGSWTRDLLQRIDQLARWVEGTYPNYYWLSGFTYPTGFLTAVLQTTARKNSIPIDTLSFEFSVLHVDPSELGAAPKEGSYMHGMFLEGAGWDFEEVRCAVPLSRRGRRAPRLRSWPGHTLRA